MPDLSDEQTHQFRGRLLAMQTQIDALLDRTTEDTRPVELGSAIGRLTRIDAIQMRGMAQMSRRQLEIRRQQVGAALAALDSGTYGSCRHCKGPIDPRRLEALPESPFCIECQEGFERA
jgi:DnaK suppressor protein